MYAIKAEWRKLRTFRELYVGLVLMILLVLVAILPSPGDFWLGVYNFNFNIAPVLILFLQVAGLSRLFCCERDGRTDWLIRTSCRGIPITYGSKTLLGVGYAAVTALLPGILAFLLYAMLCGGVPDASHSDVYQGLSRIPLAIGQLGLWGWEMLFSLLGGLCAAGLVMLISAILRRPAAVMAVSIAVFGLPALLHSGILSFVSSIPIVSPLFGLLYIASGLCWHSILVYDYQLLGSNGALLWQPILYILCLFCIELGLLWLVWKRRSRR